MFTNPLATLDHQTIMYLFCLLGTVWYIIFKLINYKRQASSHNNINLSSSVNSSPEIMRYIVQKKIDGKLFLIALINYMQRGYITVDKKIGTYYLNRTQKKDDQLFQYEKEILQTIFIKNNSLALSEEDNDKFSAAKKVFRKAMYTKIKPLYFKEMAAYQIFFIGSALLMFLYAFWLNYDMVTQNTLLPLLIGVYIVRKMLIFAPQVYKNLYLYSGSISGYRVITGVSIVLLLISLCLGAMVGILLFEMHDYSSLIIAWLFFITISFYSTEIINIDGMTILHYSQNFRTLLQNKAVSLAQSEDVTEMNKLIDTNIAFIFALDLEKKFYNLLLTKKNLFNSTVPPRWYLVPLGKRYFLFSFIYQFLPILNDAIIKNELLYNDKLQEL